MVLYREVAGTPLDRLPTAGAATAGELVAGWLTILHTSAAVLTRRLDLAHEVVNGGAWAATVGGAAPDVRGTAYALADRLAAVAADLPAVPEVPLHKDLHAAHVLAVGAGVTVVDLDEARMGDPALDLAHIATYLDVSSWPGARVARAALVAAYGPVPGPDPELRTAFFEAGTCLKIAKQLVTGRGPFPAGADRTALLPAVLERGTACLAG